MEETVLLEFVVDQSAAQKDLERTEKAMLDTKKAQQELQAQYKKGEISQEQYIKENLKLQSTLKKEQDQKRSLTKLIETESNSRNALKSRVSALTKEYDNLNVKTAEGAKRADQLQKELAQLNSEITKSSKSAGLFKDQIGNYPQQLGEAAKSINIAGTSVGDLTSKLAGFINPATAAIGVATALGSLYAQSAQGARDSAYATDLFSASIGILSKEIGDLVSSSDGGGGEGIFSKITNAFIGGIFGIQTAIKSNLIAGAKEQLRELELINIDIQGIRKQYEKAAEDFRRIRDDEEAATQTRLQAADEVTKQLNANLLVRQSFYNREINSLRQIAALQGNSPEIRAAIKKAQAESRDAEEEINGKLTENLKARQQILTLIAQQQASERRAASSSRDVGKDTLSGVTLVQPKSSQEAAVEAQKSFANDLLKVNKDYYDRDVEAKRESVELKNQIERNNLAVVNSIAAGAASLFDEQTNAYKVFASASTLISTYSAAQKAYEAAFLPVPTVASPALGAAFAAVAVATGLANVARINGVEFAEGGYTGPGGKYEPAGIVHKGEYVVPQSVNYSPAAQPHIRALEGMRKGYADGGFVTSQNISSSQQALITANTLKNLPPAQVSWTEGRAVGRRVEFRENLGKL